MHYAGLIELLLAFGTMIAICLHQLWLVRQPSKPSETEAPRPLGTEPAKPAANASAASDQARDAT
jgi:hypothetical protein